MRKFIIISLSLLLLALPLFAITADHTAGKRNGIYLETYLIRHDFSDGFVSLNYERFLGKKAKTILRIGVYPDFETAMSFPVTVCWITTPNSHHHFEYGIGAVARVEHFVDPLGINEREWFYDFGALMIPLMYRYQGNSPWFFRAGINLFVSWPTLPSPSLSVGYSF